LDQQEPVVECEIEVLSHAVNSDLFGDTPVHTALRFQQRYRYSDGTSAVSFKELVDIGPQLVIVASLIPHALFPISTDFVMTVTRNSTGRYGADWRGAVEWSSGWGSENCGKWLLMMARASEIHKGPYLYRLTYSNSNAFIRDVLAHGGFTLSSIPTGATGWSSSLIRAYWLVVLARGPEF
jgi:hypothetical protein